MSGPLRAVRRLLAWTFVLGSIGTAAELLLLEHVESVSQIVPLLLLAGSLTTWAVAALHATATARRAFQATLLLCAGSAAAGAALHLQSNVEFARELDPDVAGIALMTEALSGATPALAPGSMLLLAAVGWAHSRLDA